MPEKFKSQPEEITSGMQPPEKKGATRREIKTVPLEELLNPDIYEEYYDSVSQPESGIKGHVEDNGEKKLQYEPFNARLELIELKKNPNKKKLERFKEDLIEYQRGIAEIISATRSIVEKNPDTPVEVLLQRIDDGAKKYRLGTGEIYYFEAAVKSYQRKHVAVEKYRAMYPDNNDLFEACFGQKPKGKVEVVKGPMTLYFKCFNQEDYAFIYNFGEDIKEISKDDIDKANRTGGVALSRVKIDELAGTVNAENISQHMRYWLQEKASQQERLHQKEFELVISSQREDVDIEVEGIGSWKIKFFGRQGKLLEPKRLQVINASSPDDPPILDFDLDLAEKAALDGRYSNAMCFLTTKDNRMCGEIEVDLWVMKIRDSSRNGCVVKFVEDKNMSAPDERLSESTRVHEDQHQFNKLFKPFGGMTQMFDMMTRVAENIKDPERAEDIIIHEMVKDERRNIIDPEARDEILAQYKGGRSPEQTFINMTTLEIYDYVNLPYCKKKIAKVPSEVRKIIKEQMSQIFYDEDGRDFDYQELDIDEEKIKPHIDTVFKKEYILDLKKWTDSLAVLEGKGYSRDEVVSILYQEPVDRWPNFVRRIKDKNVNS